MTKEHMAPNPPLLEVEDLNLSLNTLPNLLLKHLLNYN